MTDFRNVHIFDGSFRNEDLKTKYTISKKQQLFSEILNKMTDKDAKNGVSLIIKNIQTGENYDNTNNKFADDILAEICTYIMDKGDKDIMKLVEEQMKDMYLLGRCPQGRTIRLWQIYNI